jgi:hypothetical protein
MCPTRNRSAAGRARARNPQCECGGRPPSRRARGAQASVPVSAGADVRANLNLRAVVCAATVRMCAHAHTHACVCARTAGDCKRGGEVTRDGSAGLKLPRASLARGLAAATRFK